MSKKTYKDYFNIDPKYYAAVTADLIKSGEVKWTSFYPHETFVKLLEKTHIMLSGKDSRSLWVEGAYGTGKSHAALTVKSMLEASDDEIRDYFKDYGLRDDLCQQLITDKSNGRLITIHRIGSASIRSDQDLILALQDSITAALQEHGITNRGEASLKEAALHWLEDKEANRVYFASLIQEDKYMWDFGGKHMNEVISVLKNSEDEDAVSKMMRNILKVAEDNGITALRLDIQTMCEWIKSIIDENDISAILFVWDEFTEYFQNNQNALTGFQTLAEISESHPFYFLIVTHESSSLIQDKDMRKKILNRFVGDVTVRIEMPENMAFRLMAQAMKTTDDPVLLPEWTEYKGDLNEGLTSVRNTIIASAKKHSRMGQKTIISDAELQSIVPIHPYAALLLKHMSVAFNSNARSMFDFIISNDMTDAKGFKWFINEYGPEESINLLTIDMLWDFFTGKDQNGLNDDVRVILDSFGLLKKGSLILDQERVFKTVLLLEAISLRVGDVELLRPNEQNIDLAFAGTDWSKGKARNIAAGLCQQGLLFEKPVGNGLKEYTVANRDGDIGKINKLKDDIRNSTKTQDLIIFADLMSAVQLPVAIRSRFVMEGAASSNLAPVSNKLSGQSKPNRFKIVVAFALNDTEAATIKNAILKAIVQPSNELFYIECLTPMGDDLLSQYVENMAYSKNYAQNDRQRAMGFETQAKKCLTEWKQRISAGAFILYTPERKSGTRVANLAALQEELQKLNHQIYFCGLEQFNLIDNMFLKGPLAQGAECGIAEELKSTFKSSNVKTSLATALEGAWKVERYWEDSTKKSLPIVRIKQEVEKVVKVGFEKASGRISILSIYEALEEAPYGFMPSNVTAFIMGFVLKEYATADYFWSNGSSSESMTPGKMKQMIANAINQKFSPSSKYKEEYIVAMSASQRCFLQCTSTAFHIPMSQCGSIESARDQIRIKMKGLTFPIWCLKYILNTVRLETATDQITTVIDAYCGIANTANSNKATESALADQIGSLVHDNVAITRNMESLLTNEMCRKGMLAYINIYQGGVLRQLANEIGDGGAYLDQVKLKFNADAANWVWSSVTADEKISDVILEYRIIAESNKSLPKCTNLRDMVLEWNKRSNNIRMPYDVLRKYAGDLSQLLVQLYYMKQSGQLQEQYKQQFYDALITQREAFEHFYKDQLPYFKQVAGTFVEELDEQDVAGFCSTIPAGQFTKSSTEYYQYIENAVSNYKKSIRKTQLKNLWLEKTGTKDPSDWSDRYDTPILCMFDDTERGEARTIFATILAYSASDADITKAINYLEAATFYDRLNDPQERDRCFMERVVGDYAIMLKNADSIRKSLIGSIPDKTYNWMDNSAVKNRLKVLAEKQYKLSGCERAQAVIDKMDATELRRYLNELIADNLTVGMEILKNE
ncbi:MAG: hypothetical protein HFG49_09935 [Lachnospiraceae bacterium]|jgi:hypothetical protein|nr:hypothetical protein [Lachnospiraceae bacterium]